MKVISNIVLGAGISGLALAYDLKKRGEEVLILEKEGRAGGSMGTDSETGFLFEKGPRTFRSSSEALLNLAHDLGLKDELIFSDPAARKRYLYTQGKLRQVPSFFLLKKLLPSLLREWREAPLYEDETLYAFAARRFSPEVAELFFDPLALGVYAGDIHTLSVRSCFPSIKEAEKEYGSLTRAFFHRKKKETALFSFRRGTQTLVDALAEVLHGQLLLHQNVREIKRKEDHFILKTDQQEWRATRILSALPASVMAHLLGLPQPVPLRGVYVVHLGYQKDLLPCSGFGYLVPTKEKEKILGVVFDSKIFPQQNAFPQETRLTVMLREEVEGSPETAALEGLQRHLGISETPDVIQTSWFKDAIPQFPVGYRANSQPFPHCYLVGNYLQGASVNDCIAGALKMSATCCN